MLNVKIKPYILSAFFLLFCVFNINAVIYGMQKALAVCAFSIVPSLFIFMLLSDITVSLLLCDGSLPFSPKIILFALGALCGFPIGASVCEQFFKMGVITEKDAEKLLPFCNMASPAFVIGAVGVSMFSDKMIGILLYFSQFIVSLFSICFIKCSNKKATLQCDKKSLSDIYFSAVEKSVYGILKVCALICFFTALLSIIENTKLKVLALILEISCGCSMGAAMFEKNPLAAIAICGFCSGFSGICVHMQLISAAKSIKINFSKLLIYKLIHGVFCALLALGLYYLFFCA